MKKKEKKPTTASKVKKPVSEKDMPVTKRLLDLKIQEVKGDVTSLRLEMKASFTQIESRFKEQDAKFLSQDSKLEVLDTKITKMMILLGHCPDRSLEFDRAVVS